MLQRWRLPIPGPTGLVPLRCRVSSKVPTVRSFPWKGRIRTSRFATADNCPSPCLAYIKFNILPITTTTGKSCANRHERPLVVDLQRYAATLLRRMQFAGLNGNRWENIFFMTRACIVCYNLFRFSISLCPHLQYYRTRCVVCVLPSSKSTNIFVSCYCAMLWVSKIGSRPKSSFIIPYRVYATERPRVADDDLNFIRFFTWRIGPHKEPI